MPKQPLPQTETLNSGVVRSRQRLHPLIRVSMHLKGKLVQTINRVKRGRSIQASRVLVGAIALLAALTTSRNPSIVQFWERNAQTLFFDLRGVVEPPRSSASNDQPGIIILAMDSETMSQGTQIYANDPQLYPYFAPIEQWPWQRTAYAIAINRLMQAGARAVVVDIVLDAPGIYGKEDDEELRRVLAKYPGQVTLAAKYNDEEKRRGYEIKLLTPNPLFLRANPRIGFINFPIAFNGRIHQLGNEFLNQVSHSYGKLGESITRIPTLAEAALDSAKVSYPPITGQDLFFYGPNQTFQHVPFWHVLDPQNWTEYHLRQQTFKDKIVLIGATVGGESFQDFHLAPFSGTLRYPEKMAGVEIQAAAIATLMQGRTISPLFPVPWQQGVLVGVLVLVAGFFPSRRRSSLRRFGYGLMIALGWGVFSYCIFVGGRQTVPTTVPIVAIGLSSLSYLLSGIRRTTRDIRRAVRSHHSQTDANDFQSIEARDEIAAQQREFIGRTLKQRYVVQDQIGAGGFGETYKAIDLDRPGHPLCVVKRLRPVNKNPQIMRLAEDLFEREAKVLHQLGKHDQIPQLLSYFEEDNEFYLVQEYINGRTLADELRSQQLWRPLSEQAVVMMLYELLQILEFVHQQKVIHRDIKPANVIRRQDDLKLVLIDFGAVKQVSDPESQAEGTVLSAPIGTRGYIAAEQLDGRPCPASDIYSLGMTAIRALTGIEPGKASDSEDMVNLIRSTWKSHVQISQPLIDVIDKMVQFDVEKRYQTASEVLTALEPLVEFAEKSGFTPDYLFYEKTFEDDLGAVGETQRWIPDAPPIELPTTDPENAPHNKAHDQA